MKKKTKIILGLTILVVIIGVMAFWPKKKTTNTIKEEKVALPTRVVTNYGSNTGAMEISLSESQYSEVYLIKDLRNKCPVDRDNFTVDFDYNVNKFVVIYKNETGISDFKNWLKETGYSVISENYFQTK